MQSEKDVKSRRASFAGAKGTMVSQRQIEESSFVREKLDKAKELDRALEGLLIQQTVDKKAQAWSLRILIPGRPQFMIPRPGRNVTSEQELRQKIQQEQSFTTQEVETMGLQIHNAARSTYLELAEVVDFNVACPQPKSAGIELSGAKIRVLMPDSGDRIHHLEMRAVPLSEIERFHRSFPGNDSRLKQKQLLDGCGGGKSWVEHDASSQAGPADLIISYSWDMSWDYMIAWLQANTSPTIRIWLDILACSQKKIADGDLSEIHRLPEVVNFAGATVFMPGTIKRLWCCYEFAWSLELNGGCLNYAYQLGQELAGVDEDVERKVQRSMEEDASVLTNTDSNLLQQAHCSFPADEQFIRTTIQGRLGGVDQVALLVKTHFLEALGVHGAGGAGGSTSSSSRDKQQRAALRTLFVKCNGANWKRKQRWCDEANPIGEWYGITTDETGEVIRIDLNSNGLGSELPSGIFGAFPALQRLLLAHNELVGEIPQLASNVRLKHLSLLGNRWTQQGKEIGFVEKTQIKVTLRAQLPELQDDTLSI